MPALERLFFSKVHCGAAVLDLCCGSGHVTKELVARGYQVAGVDMSASLIVHAQQLLPAAHFFVQDARELNFSDEFDAILSTFDSLNHILTLEDLQRVFAGARRALRAPGIFVFDMNLEEAYSSDLYSWAVTVEDADVTLVRGAYNRELHLGETELIWFQRANADENLWRRHRSVVKERCYPEQDVVAALHKAGFGDVITTSAIDAGMSAQLAFGRRFFAAR
jgi:SAM-dependent methyltransferase